MSKERIPQPYDRMHEYLCSLEKDGSPLLRSMREYAKANEIPIVREETESLIRTLTVLKRPESILEIGTAIGYSAIVMAESSYARIYTMESYEKRIALARTNIEKAGFTDRIHLMEGDAGELLKELEAGMLFDMVFLDAAKGQYQIWLEDIISHMRMGALLIADNVLQGSSVMESRFAVPRRERTTHARMREFLYTIKHDARLESSVLPVGDGVSLSVRI